MLHWRMCGPEDCKLWIQLNREFMAYELQDGALWNDADKAGDTRFAQTFQEALDSPELIDLLLFEVDSQPAGFATLLKVYSVWSHGKALILDDLFLRREYRGQGYGRQALEIVEARARELGCRRLQFQSETTNPNAKGFYTAMGYQPRQLYFYVKYFGEGSHAGH